MSINEDKNLMTIARDAVNVMGAIQEPSELAALLILLRDRDVKNLLEIGSEAGGTFYAWCQVTNKEGKKISLDLPTGASGSWNYAEPAACLERERLLRSFASDVRCVTGDSHSLKSFEDVHNILNGELLDFLFIDGDHSEQGVRQDWFMYSKLVKPGGLIAFHDIKASAYHEHLGCFVHHFWQKLDARKVEIKSGQSEWGGIGVVFV